MTEHDKRIPVLDAEPRDYYITMIREPGPKQRVAWLVGPFETHAAALAMVEPARRLANRLDPWSDFDAFGTSSLPAGTGPVGKLNSALST